MELKEKTLKYKGTEETVYFREMSAGQQLKQAKGQKFTTTQEGGSFEVDVGDQVEKNYNLVQMTLVTQEEKLVYPSLEKLLAEPKSKINALVKLAKEANDEFGKDPAGNV